MTEKIEEIDDPANADINVRVQGSNADMKNPETVQDRLRQALKASGGNKAVSQKSGLPGSTIDYALSAGSMRLQTAQQLAAATGVRLEWLASGEGPMRPGDPPPAAPAPPPPPAVPLFLRMNMDFLVDAYDAALESLSKGGAHRPDTRRLLQVTMLLYEELLEATERGEIPAVPTNKD
jgi:DNA-binding phage protein